MIDLYTDLETPNRGGSDEEAFSNAMDAFIKKLTTLTIPQINAFANALNNYSTSTTSTSNVTIGTGIKNFVVDLNKGFLPGNQLTLADSAAPADNLMFGTVVSYVPATGALSMKVKKFIGSGTKASWVIAMAGSAAFEQNRGSLAMHATTMDLWSQPEVIDGTGAAVTMTNVAAAPQPGATRTLIPPVGTVISHNAVFDVQGNANYTTALGDILILVAVTTTTFKVSVIKDDGKSISSSVAVGNIAIFPTNAANCPPDYLVLPVSATNISRTAYPLLHAFMAANGYLFGAGDGSTTFGIPSIPEGWTILQANNNVSASTAGQNLAHAHTYQHGNGNVSGSTAAGWGGGNLGTYTSSSDGGSANLAAGVKFLICIKYQ